MKKGWELRKLGEVCERITDGSHFSPKSFGNAKYPYITVRDITDEGIDFANCKFIEEEDYLILRKNGCQPQPGDILFSKDGTVGKVSLVKADRDFVVLSSLAIISPNKALIYPELLAYILRSPSFLYQALGKKTGVAIRRIILKNLKQIEISYPKSFAEQQRIVDLLDEAHAAIANAQENAEKNLLNAREIFESDLQSVFSNPKNGWKKKKLGEISKIDYGYTEKASFEEIGPRFLRITDIQDDNVDWTKVPFCRIDNSELPKYELCDGDIVFARTGATTGKSFLIKEPPFSVFASYLIKVRVVNVIEILPDFIFLFFKTNSYWEKIKNGVSGSAQGGFNASKLSDLSIPVPPLPEQQKLVSKFETLLSETKKLEAIYQQKLADLEELKKAILEKAFKGELSGGES